MKVFVIGVVVSLLAFAGGYELGVESGKKQILVAPLAQQHFTNSFMAHQIMVKRGVMSNDPNDHMFKFLSAAGIIWHATWEQTTLTTNDVEEINAQSNMQ